MKPNHAVILHPLIICAAKEIHKEEFSVDRFTESYLKLDGCFHAKKKSARQFVYRNILRLIENGEVEKLPGDGWPSYRFTKRFLARFNPSENVAREIVSQKAFQSRSKDELGNLTERLKHLKLEMLTAMGEVEEYNTLETELPSLKKRTQQLANESRDRCSKLLGKVKAIETLLNIEAKA